MAPGRSRLYRSPRRNLFSTNSMEDELARNPGPVEDLHSGSTSPAPSRHLIPGPILVPALNLAPAPASTSTNELFKKFMKAYLESNQRPRQPPAIRKQPFKAKVSRYIMLSWIWTIITFVINAKIIFRLLGLPRPPNFFCSFFPLQKHECMMEVVQTLPPKWRTNSHFLDRVHGLPAKKLERI